MSVENTVDSGVSVGVGARAFPLLLDCLHPSVFKSGDSAESVDVQRCFRILLKLLSNRGQHPTDPLYASFSAVSTAWQSGVLPCVYVLRLVAWMGCVLNAEGSRYSFHSGSSAADHLRALDHRIKEVQCVAAVWSTPLVSLGTFADTAAASPAGNQFVNLGAARESLTKLYAGAANASLTGQDAVFRMYTSALQLELLRLTSCAIDGKAEMESGVSATKASLLFTQPIPVDVSMTDDSIQWLLRHASLCELTHECERAIAFVTTAASHTLISHASDFRSPTSLSVPSLSSALRDRIRKQAQAEQHQRYLQTTGPAYRLLSQEERHRGESVIVSIAGLLEQIAVVTETQGMVRADRLKARQLLDEFKQDGDLVTLYMLEERYAAELEEAKRRYGKPLVYAEYD
ncbi:hypothetical protein ABL78_2567 [Leptomonas seymouri]|uniref:PUB domain-containing protein n=1 Tax=Leptomonas seymouri TaxID=5684 RepID=A0A0N1ILU1_LEPSE|nr:hypothetical protein ABL78_2567 [Leptomonas seymouri]|eukprot:KPI88328.1 hypothetical protein ABL78_2567 [Leptomonas seymouri]